MVTIGAQSLNQLVKINIGQQKGALDIVKAVTDPETDAFLSEKFHPMSSQLDAVRAALENIKGGSILFIGACGTGKSTLQLLLGRLLANDKTSENYASLLKIIDDVQTAKAVSQVRAAEHNWEIIVPDTKSLNFLDAVSYALKNSAQANGLDGEFNEDPGIAVKEYARLLKASDLREGIVILLDDADDLIKQAIADPESTAAESFRRFCRSCAAKNSLVLFAVNFDCEISRLSMQEEENALDIFGRIHPVSILGKTGEFEEFVSANVIEHVKGELWDALAEYKDVRSVAEGLHKSELYKGCSDRWIMEHVVLGAYPMHPASVFALPYISAIMSGKNKTAFNFFVDAAPGGLMYFLRNFAIVQPNGRLHLYALDSFYTYFEKVFAADPANAEYVKTLNKSILSAGDVPQARRILRTVLLIQLIAHDRFRTTADNVIWTMHMGEKEARVAANSLELLRAKGALSYIDKTGEYVLPIERRKVTLEEAISRMSNRVRSQMDVGAVLRSAFAAQRISAKKYNKEYGSDRFARVDVVMASELVQSEQFMRNFRDGFRKVRPYRGDMRFVVAVPESEEELEALESGVRSGIFDDQKLILAVPDKTAAISKDALLVMALEKICESELPFCDSAAPENAKAVEMLTECRERLKISVSSLLDVKSMRIRWNGKDYNNLDISGIANLINDSIEELVGAPLVLSDKNLLCMHESGSALRVRHGLISYILSCSGNFAFRSSNEEMINLLLASLGETGFVVEKECEFGWRQFKMLEDIPDSAIGHAYRFICSEITGKAGSSKITLMSNIVNELLYAPYTLTPALIEILLSLFIYRYKASLTLQTNVLRSDIEDDRSLLKTVEPSADVLFSMVSDPADWQILFSDCSEYQAEALKDLIGFMNPEFEPAGEFVSLWTSADEELIRFYKALPETVKYPFAANDAGAGNLCRLLGHEVKYPSRRSLLKEVLPEALEADIREAESCRKMFADVKNGLQILRSVVPERIKFLCSELGRVFASDNSEAEEEWYVKAEGWLASATVYDESDKWSAEISALKSIEGQTDSVSALRLLIKNLDYPEIESWREDVSGEIIERLMVMRQDIEWGVYRRAYILPAGSMVAFGVMQSVLENFSSLSLEELEEFLSSELEWASWPEAVSLRLEKQGLKPDAGDPTDWTYDGAVSEIVRKGMQDEAEEPEAVSEKAEAEDDGLKEIIVEEVHDEPEPKPELEKVGAPEETEKAELGEASAEEASAAEEKADEAVKIEASETAEALAEAAAEVAGAAETAAAEKSGNNDVYDFDESTLEWL
ncbi:hypothetical protein IJT93_02975 [bacterium]|nr:hypothetical protein [bacterium]